MSRFERPTRCNQKPHNYGVIVPFVAIILVAVLLLCGLALDGGRLLLSNIRVQRAVDAAVTVSMYKLGKPEISRATIEILARNQALNNLEVSGFSQDMLEGPIVVEFTPADATSGPAYIIRVAASVRVPFFLMQAIPGMGSLSVVSADASGIGELPLAISLTFPVRQSVADVEYETPCPAQDPAYPHGCEALSGMCNSFCLEKQLSRALVSRMEDNEWVSIQPYAWKVVPETAYTDPLRVLAPKRLDSSTRARVDNFLANLAMVPNTDLPIGGQLNTCWPSYNVGAPPNNEFEAIKGDKVCVSCALHASKVKFNHPDFANPSAHPIPTALYNRRVVLFAHALPYCQESWLATSALYMWDDWDRLDYAPGYSPDIRGPGSLVNATWHFSCGYPIPGSSAEPYGAPIPLFQTTARRLDLLNNRIALDTVPLGQRPTMAQFPMPDPDSEDNIRSYFWAFRDMFDFYRQMANVGEESDYGLDADPLSPVLDRRLFPNLGLFTGNVVDVSLIFTSSSEKDRQCFASFASGDSKSCGCYTIVGNKLPRGVFSPLVLASERGLTLHQLAANMIEGMRKNGPRPRLIE